MQLSDFSKDVRKLLLEHWTFGEIESRLSDPAYFFEQVVLPRLAYLRRNGKDVPTLRLQQSPNNPLRVILIP